MGYRRKRSLSHIKRNILKKNSTNNKAIVNRMKGTKVLKLNNWKVSESSNKIVFTKQGVKLFYETTNKGGNQLELVNVQHFDINTYIDYFDKLEGKHYIKSINSDITLYEHLEKLHADVSKIYKEEMDSSKKNLVENVNWRKLVDELSKDVDFNVNFNKNETIRVYRTNPNNSIILKCDGNDLEINLQIQQLKTYLNVDELNYQQFTTYINNSLQMVEEHSLNRLKNQGNYLTSLHFISSLHDILKYKFTFSQLNEMLSEVIRAYHLRTSVNINLYGVLNLNYQKGNTTITVKNDETQQVFETVYKDHNWKTPFREIYNAMTSDISDSYIA